MFHRTLRKPTRGTHRGHSRTMDPRRPAPHPAGRDRPCPDRHGGAFEMGAFRPLNAILAALVALLLQVGVNYASDYSYGIRGTDENRVGPLRLVGSGAAAPEHVKYAAFGAFGIAMLFGLVLIIITQTWWLLLV